MSQLTPAAESLIVQLLSSWKASGKLIGSLTEARDQINAMLDTANELHAEEEHELGTLLAQFGPYESHDFTYRPVVHYGVLMIEITRNLRVVPEEVTCARDAV